MIYAWNVQTKESVIEQQLARATEALNAKRADEALLICDEVLEQSPRLAVARRRAHLEAHAITDRQWFAAALANVDEEVATAIVWRNEPPTDAKHLHSAFVFHLSLTV
jgi:hypothetical protein